MKKKDLERFCLNILEFLKQNSKNGEFPARSFYGETYTALSMFIYNKEKYNNEIINFLNSYKRKDKTIENFHWEFNNYSLLNLYKYKENYNLKEVIFPLVFKGTKCTNWTLLRALCKLIDGDTSALAEVDEKLKNYQLKNGLIKDDNNVNSFQYHCFMCALIYHIYSLTNKEEHRISFLNGVNFIKNFTLENGCTNYVGRGQEQLFGYGPLIYIYEMAYQMTGEVEYKILQSKAFEYLKSYANDMGGVPLVLNKYEKGFPKVIDVDDSNYLGWYAYNNYFDYLPFLAYYLVLTNQSFKEVDISNEVVKKEKYFDSMFLKYTENRYSAVITAGGGYTTNDLPIPFICYDGKNITPCYGGEEYECKLYKKEGIPLPWGIVRFRKTNIKTTIKDILKKVIKNCECKYLFRDECSYCINEITENIYELVAENDNFLHIRRFTFYEHSINIVDEIEFKRKIFFKKFRPINLLFYNAEKMDGFKFRVSSDLILSMESEQLLEIDEKNYFCALGKLKCLYFEISNIAINKSDKFEFKYDLIFNKEK